MLKTVLKGATVAVTLLAAQAARADVVSFDPLASYGATTTFTMSDASAVDGVETQTINIVGFAFNFSALGTYGFYKPDGVTISDIMQVTNGGDGGTGQILFTSYDSGQSFAGEIVLGTEDPELGVSAQVDMPLAASGGLDLGVTFASGGPGSNSDSTSIDVPEPATVAILGLGLAAIGFVRRRRA